MSSITRENIRTIPNALTVARILLTPAIGIGIIQGQWEASLGILAVAGFTDVLDGFIARRYNQKTKLGSALDPAADKILMTTLVVSLCHADLLSTTLASLIIGRDLFLVAGTAYYRYITLPAPKTFNRYFDLGLVTAEVRPPLISKANTFLQIALMALSLASPIYGFGGHILMDGLRYLVGTTTIWSGLHYILDKDVIKKF